jgi:lipopolysaccharide biosynthesis regulator YciM
MQNQDSEGAITQLHAALEHQPNNVRASLMKGDIAFAKGLLDEAIANWRASEKQNPWYLPLVGPHLWKAYEAKGQIKEGLAALEGYSHTYPSIDLLKVWLDALIKHVDPETAYKKLRSEVRRVPSLLGLDQLLQMQLQFSDDEERTRDLKLIRELMSRHTDRLSRYRCQSCGFQAKQFYWQCPGCAHWDTITPRRVEELEFYPVPDQHSSITPSTT